MKKIIFVVIGFIAAWSGYSLLFDREEKPNVFLTGDNIICFGDSLSYGTGAPEGEGYPSQLAAMIDYPVINAGVPGDTTQRALARLDADVLNQSPRIVLITLGGNDLKNGIAKDVAFRNLEKIVTAIQNAGAVAVIGGIQFPVMDRGYGRMYQELAEKTSAVLIPNIYANIMGNRRLMSDPIHPNSEGYAIMANRFKEAMAPYLQ